MAINDTDISICSNALATIGEEGITSFDEGTAQAKVAKQKYLQCKQNLLSLYPWVFNESEVYLARTNSSPLAKYKYLYEKPADCLVVRTIKEGRSVIDYRFNNGKINTDAEKPSIVYSANVKEADMPPYFVSLLVDMLARDFLVPITGKHDDYKIFDNIFQNSFTLAKTLDAKSKTPSIVDTSLLLGVRS